MSRGDRRYCGAEPTGASATAEAFGADVRVRDEGSSLFLVVGRAGAPDRAVLAAGGKVVTRLPGARRVLAVAPLAAYGALAAHAEVALAGPVSIDAGRFAAFARLIALEAPEP